MIELQEETLHQATLAETISQFESRFLRCQGLLYFIAGRILAKKSDADRAVLNCWRTASRCSPEYPYEGDFRAWLLRVLIQEALAIRESRKQVGLSLAAAR